MRTWITGWWRGLTTTPCDACGRPVKVREFRQTGNVRGGSWWAAKGAEVECPECGATFWIKK
jgi:endogenous inhibitor of DNA gyrase (YacG/DUF329 family)